jgi:tRNA 2-thiouridine synthesizing protein E
VNIAYDDNGYLRDLDSWDAQVAQHFAELEEVTLTDAHWEIIHLIRQFYQDYGDSPANRALVKYTRQNLGPEKGTSMYLLSLFPGSPTRLASRIAGLPKPKNCL